MRARGATLRDPAWLLAGFLAGVLALSRLFPLSALVDLATGEPAAGAALVRPSAHVWLTPLCAFADWLSCNGALQHVAFLLFLMLCFAPFRLCVLAEPPSLWRQATRALPALGLYLTVCAAFLAAVWLLPRPASRLELSDPEELAVDFHSHTAASWDGRPGFALERNAAWHEAAGFAAGFVTDHNLQSLPAARRVGAYTALPGSELSLHDAHVLVYGWRGVLSREDYSDGEPGLLRLLGEAPSRGALAVPSLPEYWRHHRERLAELAGAGAPGFELLAGSPRGVDASDAARYPVVDLCRRRGLFVVSGSDNHGYPAAACSWTVVRLPGWRGLSPAALERRLVGGLRAGLLRPRVIARRRRAAAVDGWPALVEAPRGLWLAARTWTLGQCVAAAAWLLAAAALLARFRKRPAARQ